MSRYYRKRYYKKRYYRNSYDTGGDINPVGVLTLFFLATIGIIIKFIRENFLWILLGFLLIIIIVIIIKRKQIKNYFVNRHNRKVERRIIKKSQLYAGIVEVNDKYNINGFVPFVDRYQVAYKSNLETGNLDDYLLMTMHTKYDSLKSYKLAFDQSRQNYENYEREYESLRQYINDSEAERLKLKVSDYVECANKMFEQLKNNNKPEFRVDIYLDYSSNKGFVNESKSKTYNEEQFSMILNEYLSLKNVNKLNEISARIERSKVSESLRYDVLKRDNFRCQICGATAQDGAKLQVDHIVPVSKGGKTEMSNLQTLCSRCNAGKSDKM